LNGVEKAIEAAAAGMIKICGRTARVRRRTRKKKVKRNQGEHPMSEESPPILSRNNIEIPATNVGSGHQLNSQKCTPNDNFHTHGGLSNPHISSPPPSSFHRGQSISSLCRERRLQRDRTSNPHIFPSPPPRSFHRGQSISPRCRERRLQQERIRQALSCHGNFDTTGCHSDKGKEHCYNEPRVGSSSFFTRTNSGAKSPPPLYSSGYFPNEQQLLLHRNRKNDNYLQPRQQQQQQLQHNELFLTPSSRRNYSSMERVTSGLESIRVSGRSGKLFYDEQPSL